MKLIFCDKCQDVFKLTKTEKSCECGKCRGKAIDNINAVYNDGIPLGFNNPDLLVAILLQPVAGMGKDFTAFVIPKNVKTMIKCDNFDHITSKDFG